MPERVLSSVEETKIRDRFTYHAPKDDQPERYKRISDAFADLAILVAKNTIPCADQTVALRKLEEARMAANAVIALNE